jgi:hypothetical protein
MYYGHNEKDKDGTSTNFVALNLIISWLVIFGLLKWLVFPCMPMWLVLLPLGALAFGIILVTIFALLNVK